MDSNHPDKGTAQKTPLVLPPDIKSHTALSWPWGLVAIGFMALAWVGVYLIWNGFVLLFGG